MHELSFTKNILGVAERYAKENGARKIKTIYLRLGILRDLQEDWVQRYFGYISKGTIAEGADIMVMVEPVVCACNVCDERFGVDLRELLDDDLRCPNCEAHDYELVSGMEFVIQGIEVE